MIPPSKLFRPLRPTTVSPRDARRLAPHLASTGRLNVMLVLDSVSTEDLQRMLLLESTGRYGRSGAPRYAIVRKLVARILARERERMVAIICS